MSRYPVPARETRAEITVVNSRFIATTAPASSVDEAKTFISRIKTDYTDASHNVPAFLVGHGSSLISHCSDDGEPSGTAGRPVLAVLTGSGLGDIAVVVSRYFGGAKLGRGGLVRAYGDAVRSVLAILPRAEKVFSHTVMLALPYNWFERVRLLIASHNGQILDQDFAADITITARFEDSQFHTFQCSLTEASRGRLQVEQIESGPAIVPIGSLG